MSDSASWKRSGKDDARHRGFNRGFPLISANRRGGIRCTPDADWSESDGVIAYPTDFTWGVGQLIERARLRLVKVIDGSPFAHRGEGFAYRPARCDGAQPRDAPGSSGICKAKRGNVAASFSYHPRQLAGEVGDGRCLDSATSGIERRIHSIPGSLDDKGGAGRRSSAARLAPPRPLRTEGKASLIHPPMRWRVSGPRRP